MTVETPGHSAHLRKMVEWHGLLLHPVRRRRDLIDGCPLSDTQPTPCDNASWNQHLLVEKRVLRQAAFADMRIQMRNTKDCQFNATSSHPKPKPPLGKGGPNLTGSTNIPCPSTPTVSPSWTTTSPRSIVKNGRPRRDCPI